MNSESTVLSFDSQLTAIHHVERRQLLLALLRGDATDDSPLDVSQLPTSTDEQQLRMCHVHLPKLKRMGIIESNGERYHINRGPHFDKITPLLRLLDAHRDELSGDLM